DLDDIMPTALLSSTFFVASLVHVPLGPGSVHLVLSGLLGIILGWASFPAILIALLLQAVFFQFGGLTVLGVNTVVIAVPAVFCSYLISPWLEQEKTRPSAAFVAGILSILLSSLLMALVLGLSDQGFAATAKIILAANLPIMLIEGCISMFIIDFLAKVQPEILHLESV
ncbi:MAG: cobalt transporter CbiM, partial [Candidatus Electrothrix sp. AR3]|nr:cobalt transporter CbiM [Candidatus Electrothrix sp. AR3]